MDLVSKSVEPISYSFELNGVKWIHPSSLNELLEVMVSHKVQFMLGVLSSCQDCEW